MTTTQERLADALRKARLHVWASAGAEHMMDGFGPRSAQPSDLLLAEIDAALAAHDAEQAALPQTCNKHPDAQHGFDRNGSHSEDRYVCVCESWVPPERASAPGPVAWLRGVNNAFSGADLHFHFGPSIPTSAKASVEVAISPKAFDWMPLYTAPPAARVSVLDAKTDLHRLATEHQQGYFCGWNDYHVRNIVHLRAQGVEVVA